MGNSCTSSFIAYVGYFLMSDFLLRHYGLMVFLSGHMSIKDIEIEHERKAIVAYAPKEIQCIGI